MKVWIRTTAVALLAISLGLHWIVLQTAAWTDMLVTNSRSDSLKGAIERTFDGKHPCKLCRLVQEGRSGEKATETQAPSAKLEAPVPAATGILLFAPLMAALDPGAFPCPESRSQTPPLPPPRGS